MRKNIAFGVREIGEVLGIGKSKAAELVANGKIPCRWIGKRQVVSIDDLKAWLAKQPSGPIRKSRASSEAGSK